MRVILFLILFVGCISTGGNTFSEKKTVSEIPEPRKKEFINSGYDENIDKNECLSDTWKKFRKDYYFNFQSVSEYGDEKTGYTVIVSEPPPEVKFDQIKSTAEKRFTKAEVFTCTAFVGVDGWRRDVVIRYKGTKKSSDELVGDLQKLIFGSELTSNVKPHSNEEYKYNYPLKSGQIQRYLKALYPKISFEKAEAKVYGVKTEKTAEDKALVVWVIDKKKPITDAMKPVFRKFALGTDIIVAGINYPDKLAIVGRRRTIPTTVFPPLRFESLKTLVLIANKEREHKQKPLISFRSASQRKLINEDTGIKVSVDPTIERRKNLQNGFSSDSPDLLNQTIAEQLTGLDWAEANTSNWQYSTNYVTPYIANTEIGHTLTGADIFLKSLSKSGEMVGENFKYLLPIRYPNEAARLKILSRKITSKVKSRSFVYNWNNEGVTEKVQDDTENLLTLRSTASMNVAFSPEENAFIKDGFEKEKEELNQVYTDFFSNGDGRSSTLACVVRLAFLRDILKEADLKKSKSDEIKSIYAGDGISEIQNEAFNDNSKVNQILKSHINGKEYNKLKYDYNDNIKENEGNLTLDKIEKYLKPVKEGYGKVIESLKPLNLKSRISNYTDIVKESKNYKEKSNWINTPTLFRSTNAEYFSFSGGHNNDHKPQPLRRDLISSGRNDNENNIRIERFGSNQYRLIVDEPTYGAVKNELLEDIKRMQGKEFSDDNLRKKEKQFGNILNSILQRTTREQVTEEAVEILEMNTDAIQKIESSAGKGKKCRTHCTFLFRWDRKEVSNDNTSHSS